MEGRKEGGTISQSLCNAGSGIGLRRSEEQKHTAAAKITTTAAAGPLGVSSPCSHRRRQLHWLDLMLVLLIEKAVSQNPDI